MPAFVSPLMLYSLISDNSLNQYKFRPLSAALAQSQSTAVHYTV